MSAHPQRFLPEIEGLRALAVLSVVLFHTNPALLPGGFVGVDIFFVISGFLITRLLLAEAEATGRVDLPAFWARRVRRLLPNAALVLTVCVGLVLWLGAPFRWSGWLRDIAAAALQVANYRFARSAVDYFGHAEPPGFVLHFWSLAVEEQFYMVWPLLILALARAAAGPSRLRGAVAIALGTIFVGSFAIGLMHLASSQPRAFFHTEARIWQLAAGGLLAVGAPRLAGGYPALGWGLRQAGLLVMVAVLCGLDVTSAYPGWLALLPVAGAAAFITGALHRDAGGPWAAIDLAGRLMRHPVAGWIGARSYSWYLWHWPLIVAAQLLWPGQPLAAAGAALMSLGVAAFVFTALEDPIRRGRRLPAAAWPSLATGVVVMAGLTALALAAPALATRAGFGPGPVAMQVTKARTDFARNDADGCHLPYEKTVQPACRYGAADGQKRVVLVGDSHAAQWFAPLDIAAREAGWALQAWTKSSCPLLDAPIWYPPRRVLFTQCAQWREAIMNRLTGQERPDLVILANLADYSGYLWDVAKQRPLAGPEALAAQQQGLARVLERLVAAGVPVVVLRDTPRAEVNYADCLSRLDPARCTRPRAAALLSEEADLGVARRFAPAVRTLDLTDRICGPATCPAWRDGMVVYQDTHHLTAIFAATLADAFRPLLVTP